MAHDLQIYPKEKRLKIRRGQPIRECGLDWFPITMDNYEEFVQCKEALVLRLSSLPVRYACMDYFSAVFALEYDALVNEKNEENSAGNTIGTSGIFVMLMHLIGLALRIEVTPAVLNESIYYRSENGRVTIEKVHFEQTDADGIARSADLTPADFSFTIRPLIAAQNRITLPDESENAELVDAYETKKELGARGISLNTDTDDLVSSVAYLSQVTDQEILEWTVRDFENRRRAIDRVMKHQLYTQAELGGMVSFKNGNPYPSWCFDSIDNSLGTMAYSELEKTLAGAVSNGGMNG